MIANRPQLLHSLACRNLTEVTCCLSIGAPGKRNSRGSRIGATKPSGAFVLRNRTGLRFLGLTALFVKIWQPLKGVCQVLCATIAPVKLAQLVQTDTAR
jgi:hypothetical protein